MRQLQLELQRLRRGDHRANREEDVATAKFLRQDEGSKGAGEEPRGRPLCGGRSERANATATAANENAKPRRKIRSRLGAMPP